MAVRSAYAPAVFCGLTGAYRGVVCGVPGRNRMTPLPTTLQVFHGLVVAALVALAAVHGSAQSNTQGAAVASPLSAALACVESSRADLPPAGSLRAQQYSDPQAALDLEESESDGDQEVARLVAYVPARLASQPLPTFYAADHSSAPVAPWASLLVSSCHPRGPPRH